MDKPDRVSDEADNISQAKRESASQQVRHLGQNPVRSTNPGQKLQERFCIRHDGIGIRDVNELPNLHLKMHHEGESGREVFNQLGMKCQGNRDDRDKLISFFDEVKKVADRLTNLHLVELALKGLVGQGVPQAFIRTKAIPCFLWQDLVNVNEDIQEVGQGRKSSCRRCRHNGCQDPAIIQFFKC